MSDHITYSIEYADTVSLGELQLEQDLLTKEVETNGEKSNSKLLIRCIKLDWSQPQKEDLGTFQ